jgi:hypothetical protein
VNEKSRGVLPKSQKPHAAVRNLSITFGMKFLLTTLRTMPDAAILWPSGDDFFLYNDLIVARHPRLTGAFASIDGLNLACQTSEDDEIENATYNGWLCEHFVSSVFGLFS